MGVEGSERFSQAPRRPSGVVGVGIEGLGGVMGLEVRGPARGGGGRGGGISLSFFSGLGFEPALVGWLKAGEEEGGVGRGLETRGTEKAEPMSESVSERTCMRSEGAMAGMWCVCVSELVVRVGDGIEDRSASARRSSTIVLSSRIASSTSVLVLRRLLRLESMCVGSVFERARAGDGRRAGLERGDERLLWVLERLRDVEGRGDGSRWESSCEIKRE